MAMKEKLINITGKAMNVDGRAALVAENIGTYYLAEMDRWKEEWLNKNIHVIGDLITDRKRKSMIIGKPVVQLL